MCDNKDSVVFMVCLGCHCSPFDGLGDEDSISYMCVSLAHPLSKECGAKGAKKKIWSLSCGEWNCMKLVGQINGIEK